MVAEHDVGDLLGADPVPRERVQDRRARRHHPGVDDHDRVAVAHQHDRGADAIVGVPLGEHVEPRGSGGRGRSRRCVRRTWTRSTSAYRFSTTARFTFSDGVSSPSSIGQVAVEDPELLDRLPPVEPAVELVDALLHVGDATCGSLAQRREVAASTPLACAPTAVTPSTSSVISAAAKLRARHHHLAGDRADRLELATRCAAARCTSRREVLSRSFLRSVMRTRPCVVELADVAGGEPAVAGQHLGGLLGQVVVAAHDAAAADHDLAVVGDPDLGARHRLARRCRSRPGPAG